MIDFQLCRHQHDTELEKKYGLPVLLGLVAQLGSKREHIAVGYWACCLCTPQCLLLFLFFSFLFFFFLNAEVCFFSFMFRTIWIV